MKRIIALALLIAMAASIISLGSGAIWTSGDPMNSETQYATESTNCAANDAN